MRCSALDSARAAVDNRFEQPTDEGALLDASSPVPLLERGAGGERHEVDGLAAIGHASIEIAQLRRQHGDAGRQRLGAVAADVELGDVLPGDVGVGADVDDVDAVDGAVVLQPLDRTCDHAASDERLAHPDLVGDEEAVGGIGVVVEPAQDVVDGLDLEVLQRRERRVGCVSAHVRVLRRSRAAVTDGQNSPQPRGGPCGLARSPQGELTRRSMSSMVRGAVAKAVSTASRTPAPSPAEKVAKLPSPSLSGNHPLAVLRAEAAGG